MLQWKINVQTVQFNIKNFYTSFIQQPSMQKYMAKGNDDLIKIFILFKIFLNYLICLYVYLKTNKILSFLEWIYTQGKNLMLGVYWCHRQDEHFVLDSDINLIITFHIHGNKTAFSGNSYKIIWN